MSTLHADHAPSGGTYADRYVAAAHFRDRDHEFESVKMGVWLFLSTEILLFAGMFVGYAILRMLHPEAFIAGSGKLSTFWGLLNTVVLLISSWTVAMAVRSAQLGKQGALQFHLIVTNLCATAFVVIKLVFEYYPKWQEGKLPGKWFSYPYAVDPSEPLWWGIYFGSTAIHATHVIIGMGLLTWLLIRARKGHFGPHHYTAVEGVGLYWHIVDMVWIFLFPLLYLIH
ncbi:MAG: cytochrome c oxidase subunit 3 [Phycisphaerae bacterium]|nr:cytochrome c oxidase subunit 3 [Phycisphaerae bacterium]